MQDTTYHRILRVTSLVFALVLLFESGLVSQSTKQISRGTEAYLANAVGMSAGVRPTELNQYTAALAQKEQELANREAALSKREISVELSGGRQSGDTTTYVLAGILFILLLLILLNYTLDYLRLQENHKRQIPV